MRHLIVGAGGVGAMAAWQLARAGHSVHLWEQFQIDHDLGSSYGDSRIVRRVYPDPVYTALMADAYALWDELQALTPEEELFVRAGGIFVGPAEDSRIIEARKALELSGVDHLLLTPRDCARRFPAFCLQPHEVAIYEPSMGYARASACVRAAARLAEADGAQFHTHQEIVDIGTGPEGVFLTTRDGQRHSGDRLLLTAGPWTGRLLERLGAPVPLVVTRQAYIHLQPARNDADFEVGRFPVWIDIATNRYGFPRLGALPGVKIACHDPGEATTPETVDREIRAEDEDRLREYARIRLPWLGDRVIYAKICLYTNTPDEDFLLGPAPGAPGVFVIGGLSGHGFKFTPLLGRIAADMLTDTPIADSLSRFRLDRFEANRSFRDT